MEAHPFARCVNIHTVNKNLEHRHDRLCKPGGRKRLNKYFPWETFLSALEPADLAIFFKYFYRINISVRGTLRRL